MEEYHYLKAKYKVYIGEIDRQIKKLEARPNEEQNIEDNPPWI